MTRLKEKEYTCTKMGQPILESGSTISSTATARRSGLTVHSTKAASWKDLRKVMGHSFGSMGVDMMASSRPTISRASDTMSGPTGGNIREYGRTTRCMETECSHGRMDDATKETISTTRRKDMASLPGQTAGHTRDIGKMANKMAEECIKTKMVYSEADCGVMARKSNG